MLVLYRCCHLQFHHFNLQQEIHTIEMLFQTFVCLSTSGPHLPSMVLETYKSQKITQGSHGSSACF